MTTRTRFAPSPTGFIHLGNIRSALYPWAFARSTGGTFILRIEDTDVERSTQEAVDVILEGMAWLGLDHDEGPYYQMERMDRYKEVLVQMQAQELVYPCYMSVEELDALRERQMANKEKPRYDGTWRPEPGKKLPPVPEGVKPVLRFRNPLDGVVAWDDKVKGRIEIGNAELDDLVIARPDGTPTYNFCVVVDDIDMDITHVIRGDDHVNNTPRQINLIRAVGGDLPVYGHVPQVNGADGKPLSKRHGSVNVQDFRAEGYLPEALMNFLALLGWAPDGETTVMSRDELIERFSLERVSPSPAQFDYQKLDWLNGVYLRELSQEEFTHRLVLWLGENDYDWDAELVARTAPLVQEKISRLSDFPGFAGFFFGEADPDPAELDGGGPMLAAATEALAEVEPFDAASIESALREAADGLGLKPRQAFQPVRVAVTGSRVSPGLFESIQLLGRETTLRRLRTATEAALRQ